MKPLANVQEEDFCREYLEDFSPTEAARRARFPNATARETAELLLSRSDIQHRLKELEAMRTLAPDDLPENIRRFCERYVETFNVEGAAIYAGVAPERSKEFAMECLRHPEGRVYIRALKEEQQRVKHVSSATVLGELASIAMSNIADIMSWEDNTITLKSSDELPRHITAAIAEISETKHGLKIKFHNKIKALEALAKAMELFGNAFVDQNDVSNEIGRASVIARAAKQLEGLDENQLKLLEQLKRSSDEEVIETNCKRIN